MRYWKGGTGEEVLGRRYWGGGTGVGLWGKDREQVVGESVCNVVEFACQVDQPGDKTVLCCDNEQCPHDAWPTDWTMPVLLPCDHRAQ